MNLDICLVFMLIMDQPSGHDKTYLDYRKKVIKSLKTENYILPKDLNVPFILDHIFGDWSKRDEMDEPIVYGDYYFLQTLLRLRDFSKS